MDAFELTEWMEYWKLEPFGDEWEQTAAICEASMFAAGRGDGVDRNLWRPFRREKPPQSPEEMKRELGKLAAFLEASKAAADAARKANEAEAS